MENEPDEQLAIIAQARVAVADRLVTPWWYHPVLGLLLAGYVAALSLGSNVVKLAGGVLFIAGCMVLVNRYKRMTGVWISGFDARGRAAWWAKGLGLLIGVVIITAWAIAYFTNLAWMVWCLAALAFVATIVLGRRFDAALRAQLRAGT